MPKINRRNLSFTCLQDAVNEAQFLLNGGYQQTGNWNLAQVLGHCNDWLSFPMDGYPPPPLLLSPVIWLARHILGNSMRRKILLSGKMQSGAPTMPKTVKKPNFSDDARMVQLFADTVKRFEQFTGRLHASPLFGTMTNEEHKRLQIIHLQHHLSFLVPKQNA